MSVKIKNTQRFNTKKSITNSRNKGKSNRLWKLESDNKIIKKSCSFMSTIFHLEENKCLPI